MSHSKEVVERIIELKQQGLSHRAIAVEVFGEKRKQSSVQAIVKREGAIPTEPSTRVHSVRGAVHNAPSNSLRIMVIPDAQVKKGVPLNHLRALGNYIAAKKPDVIVNIGDFADMPSLSQYDKAGSKTSEGGRYKDDIAWAKKAMETLMKPIREVAGYHPRLIFTLGNHEHRITRAIQDNPRHYEGVIGLEDLGYEEAGWEVYPFLEMVEVNGVHFSHYYVNPNSLTKNVIGGTMDTKLKNLGFSFVMGHQQTFQHGLLYRTNGTCVQGIVAGAFYQHNEGYMGVQGNKSHWRGAVCLNDVVDGNYDIMPLSLKYLLERWDF